MRDLERRWVSLLDSTAWRRVSRSPTGRRLLRSRAFRAADTSRRFVQTSLMSRRRPDEFDSVRTFCLFLGTVKSGGTLVGALLDAHRDIILSDEADPLRYVESGFSREQMFHQLARTSRREAMKGRVTARRLQPYSLAVPGQHQGRSPLPLVIGDSRAGPTTRRLGTRPELLDALSAVLGDVEPRFLHVVRDPYDPISAMVLRSGRSLDDAIADYAAQCHRAALLRDRIPPDRLLTVHYEDLLEAPAAILRGVCAFLGVAADEGHLAACAAIVDPTRPGERHGVEWPAAQRQTVVSIARELPFLHRYADEQVGPR